MGSYVFSGSMASLANLEFAAHGNDSAKVSGHEKRRKKTTRRKKKKWLDNKLRICYNYTIN